MKRLWLCIGISLLCHALFFPDFLQAMLASGAASKAGESPKRVNIKLVSRPKAREVAVVKPAPPKPKARPRPVPPRPRVQPRPAAPAARVARRPERRPKAAPARPSRPVRVEPARTAPRASASRRPGGRPPRSTRRLTAKPGGTGIPRAAVPTAPEGEQGGRAGALPPAPGEADAPIGDGDGQGEGGLTPPAEPVAAQPPTEPVSEPQPASEPARPAPPEPKAPPAPQPPPPEPPKEPTRSASAAPRKREAAIEVPTLKLPASLRREALKTSLKVRVVIEADGSADFKLAESSGNADVDDFVLEQLRKVAVVTTALDDQGQPRRVMKPVQVKIEVD